VRVAEQVVQHEPSVAGPLTDAAVHHDVVIGAQPHLILVDGLKLGPGAEGGILGRRPRPGDAAGTGDVPAAERAFLRVVGHVQQLAGVLTRRAHVDQWLAEVGSYLVLEHPDLLVVAVDDRVVRLRPPRDVGGDRVAFGDPLGPPAIHQAQVRMPEQRADPQRIRGPPVVLVAVEHQRGVPADPLLRHQPGEAGPADVVAGHRVVEFGVPVELDRARDVAGVIQQHILIGLGHHQAGVVKVLCHPLGRHHHLRVGIIGELRRGVIGQRHC
jgi:hypothetical protein